MSAKKYPIFFDGQSMVLTAKEKELLDYVVESGSIADAAKKAGMELAAAKEFLKSERVRNFVKHQVDRIARRNDITLESVLDRLHKIAWGEIQVNRFEMKALEVLAHYLNIIKPPQTNLKLGINVETNPLEKLSDRELDALIAKRVEAAKLVGPEKNGTQPKG